MGDVHGLHIDDLQRHVANEDWTEVAAWNRRLQAALQDPTPADDIERHLARLRELALRYQELLIEVSARRDAVAEEQRRHQRQKNGLQRYQQIGAGDR
ncbi:MAG: hypothetical protein SV583_11425 [Pseudomonadota bacterium]|nr:hypothetical protein [Pseudomonadota bacterium]